MITNRIKKTVFRHEDMIHSETIEHIFIFLFAHPVEESY